VNSSVVEVQPVLCNNPEYENLLLLLVTILCTLTFVFQFFVFNRTAVIVNNDLTTQILGLNLMCTFLFRIFVQC
jgi:hypothetical protein